jgi:uncharacterized membrane protein YcaP (DUF421 family)
MRTVFAFFLLLSVTRILGRKIIAKMTFFDFAVAITLGSVTANIGFGGDSSFHAAVTVLLTLGLLTLITGFLSIKSLHFSKLVNAEPLILIQNNQIVETNMKKARITLTDLTSMLRKMNAFDIGEVNYAILENDGKLSVLFKSDKKPATTGDLQIKPRENGLTKDIIIDGHIMHENLNAIGLNENWLINELKAQGIKNIEEVFFAALDATGSLYISKGIQGKEQPGEYGIE